jgi:ABC-type Fe3+-hydroxamate transport system substrate-binding protein
MLHTFTDHLHHAISVAFPPRRIVSVVPSQTELLYDLGLNEEVVGITKFCVHPAAWFHSKTRVGGTKRLNLNTIAALQPDLIIGNKEENERRQVEALSEHFPVWLSDVQTLEEALDMIGQVGKLVNREARALEIVGQIRTDFAGLSKSERTLGVAYFIWQEPLMVAAAHTFIHEMLQKAGFQNVFANKSRYPEITWHDLAHAQPDLIFLSSEPYPFQEKHFTTFQQVCPLAVVQIVDGELFSWYGSRLLQSAAYFRELQGQMAGLFL